VTDENDDWTCQLLECAGGLMVEDPLLQPYIAKLVRTMLLLDAYRGA
jgi:hypothetical protein